MNRVAAGASRRGPDLVILGALLVGAVIVRLFVMPISGHDGDVRVTSGWAERMAAVGPFEFYENSGSIYPALLYVLWPLGILLDGDALELAVKGLAIPFDLAIGALLYVVLDRRFSAVTATIGASLYLFNPGVIVAGPLWGQIDAAGTLFALAAAVAAARHSYGWAGALAVIATLNKPQFGFAVLAVGAATLIVAWRERRWTPPFDAAVGGALAYGVIAIPLLLSPIRYLGLLGDTAARHPVTSLYAFNPWALVAPWDSPDEAYAGIGLALLVIGLAGSLIPIRRGNTLATVLAVSALMALSLYFLPTRVHERYLFPVLALLVPFVAVHARLLVPFAILSIGYAITLIYTLVEIAGLQVPLADVLTADASVWVLAFALMGAAAWFVVSFVLGPPSLDPPEAGAEPDPVPDG